MGPEESRSTDVSRACRALFPRPSRAGKLRLGMRGWKGRAHFAWVDALAPRFLRTCAFLRHAYSQELKQRREPEGTERASSDRVWPLPHLGVQSAGTRKAGDVPAALSPGSLRQRRPRRGRCDARAVASAAAGETWAVRPPPLLRRPGKLNVPSAARAFAGLQRPGG